MTTSSGSTSVRSDTALLEPLTRAAEQLARLFGACAKVGYTASLFIGYWVLHAYCIDGGVPVPVPDASLLVYLVVFAATCFIVMIFVAGGPLFFFYVTATSPEFGILRPTNSTWLPSLQDALRFIRRLPAIFLPCVLSSLSAYIVSAIEIWKFPELAEGPIHLWSLSFLELPFFGGLLVLVVGVIASILHYKRRPEHFLLGELRTPPSIGAFTWACLMGSFLAFGWTFSVVTGILILTYGTPVLDIKLSAFSLFWLYIIILLFLFAEFFLLTWARNKTVLISGLVVIITGIVICAPRVGAMTLHALGYGGGLYISLVAHIVDTDAATMPLEKIEGCLVLRTATQITVLRPIDKQVVPPKCHLNPLTQIIINGSPIATRVDTIRQEDVLDILSIRLQP